MLGCFNGRDLLQRFLFFSRNMEYQATKILLWMYNALFLFPVSVYGVPSDKKSNKYFFSLLIIL